jgi:hypothetical protein
MKQACKDYALRLMVLLVLVLAFALLVLGVRFRRDREGEPLELPAASEVTVCYYIPDLARPYEQEWIGGGELEAVLAELAATEFTEAEEAPDEETFRAALVIATNEEQITVHVDDAGTCWVYDETRGWMKGGETNGQ